MSRIGFCDGTYTLPNLKADAQEAINLYPEADGSGSGASAMNLVGTPGLALFAQVGGAANAGRGSFTVQGRTFWAIDAQMYELLANGVLNPLGNIGNDGGPVSFAACPQQLLVTSAGKAYTFQLAAQQGVGNPVGTFAAVQNPPWGNAAVTQVAYIDGFFFALIANSQTIYSSNSFDATIWPALNIKIINTFADNVVSMIADHNFLYLHGAKSSEVDYDAGSFPFPLSKLQSGTMEQGCGAQFATVQCDNAVFWLGLRNDQGQGIAWRASGSQPVRISTHAVERAWASYPKISDAVAFVYQDGGHTFWCIKFPSSNQPDWCYDVATGRWHRRGFWNVNLGIYQPWLPACHTSNFGVHLVGDRASGKIYQMSEPVVAGGGWNFVTDSGALIRRLRRSPHVNSEHQMMRYSLLEIYLETGIAPQPPLVDGAGSPRGPQISLRCSRDGGHTWGQSRDADCGQAGNYLARTLFRRLGRARDMVFELTMSDPVPWRVVDAYLNPQVPPSPRKRLVHQYAEVS